MTQKTKRQHFVPRCYLARFASDGERLFAFDKADRRAFPTNVMNVAQQKYFYDIPGDIASKAFPDQQIDVQFVEKSLSQAEGFANTVLSEIIEAADKTRVIPRPLRLKLAPYIILQAIRTSLTRAVMNESNQKMMQAIADDLVRMNFPDVPEDHYPEIKYNRDVLPILQAQHVFNEDHVVEMAAIINRHIWFIGTNTTIQPYYTSDHPVVKKANVRQAGRSFNGFRSPGIEIAFPLSSRHILVMLERTYFRRMERYDGKAVPMDPFGVEHFNTLQVEKCHRQVYCEAEEFEQAPGVCRSHPELCSPDRPRVTVMRNGDLLGMLFDD